MGVDPISLGMMAFQAVSGFMQYSEQKKADKAAKNRAFAEARLMEEDAERAALEEKRQAEHTRRVQKMAFLKSGVELSDSPLLVMEETRRRGAENAANVMSSAKAKANLVRQEGSVKRASLFGSIAETAGGMYGTYLSSQQLKKATTNSGQLK